MFRDFCVIRRTAFAVVTFFGRLKLITLSTDNRGAFWVTKGTLFHILKNLINNTMVGITVQCYRLSLSCSTVHKWNISREACSNPCMGF